VLRHVHPLGNSTRRSVSNCAKSIAQGGSQFNSEVQCIDDGVDDWEVDVDNLFDCCWLYSVTALRENNQERVTMHTKHRLTLQAQMMEVLGT